MHLDHFNFDLPQALIARYPLAKRSGGRLLCVERAGLSHRQFGDVVDLVQEGDLLVFNDTKVIPARLLGHKHTGGQIELLVERIIDDTRIMAQIRASKTPHVGDDLFFPQGLVLRVLNRNNQFYELQYSGEKGSILKMIEEVGQIPLPPYMQRSAEHSDQERYQTVYAKYKGSVAAPTAGLHFDEILLQKLQDKKVEMGYLTLHIGAGTFQPVRVQNIVEHKMHAEYLEVSAQLCEQIAETKARAKRVICVGTTSMRALETACQSGAIAPYQGETSIFIYPGYTFRCVDVLISNLHLPRSSLLILACAFGGVERIMSAYQAAIAHAYRFYSYGDAMWIEYKDNSSRMG
jgi:S-adenosylmethionine:tRNA ribosyltransferase-isomerase